jgi:hypothetical protein
MKSAIAITVCAIGAFIGLQVYLGRRSDAPTQTAEAPLVYEPRQEEEEPPPRHRPKKPAERPRWMDDRPKNTGSGSKKTESGTKKTESSNPTTKQDKSQGGKQSSKSGDMYFVAEGPFNKGIPSNVVIYNTQLGKFKIMLLSDSRNTGELYGGSGKRDGHTWEVMVRSGSVSVTWDGKSVPQRQ